MSGPPGMAGAEYCLSLRNAEELQAAVAVIMACDLSHHFAVHKDTHQIFASGLAFGTIDRGCGCLLKFTNELSSATSS